MICEFPSGLAAAELGCERRFCRFPLSWQAKIITPDRVRARLRRASQQLRETHQVVGGSDEGEHPADPSSATMTGLAKTAHCLHPAEHLLDALANAQADRVTGMARGAAINGGATRLVFCVTCGITPKRRISATKSWVS